MTGIDAIRTSLRSTQQLVTWFLSDLSDADLLVRPVAGANHIAWQVGHLILSEPMLAKSVPGAAYPEMPANFATSHAQDRSTADGTEGYLTRAEYVDLFTK